MRIPIGLIILFGLGCYISTSDAQQHTINISNFSQVPAGLSGAQLAQDWLVQVWEGPSDYSLEEHNQKRVLHLRSREASFSVYKEMDFDLTQHPILNWEWKVITLPQGADARLEDRDDQAAGIYAIFPRFPAFLNSRVIGYVWENSAPTGSVLQSRNNGRVHYVVVRRGKNQLGQWLRESRNVLEDYREIFEEEPPHLGGISLMIDSDHTRSHAESYFGLIELQSR